MKMRFAAASLVLALAAATQAPAAMYPIYTTTPDQIGNQPASDLADGLQLGLDFQANWATVINGLGAYTNGTSPITVALFNLTTGGPAIEEVTIPAGAVTGQYTYLPIGPTTLVGGDLYQVTATGYTATNLDYNPDEAGGAGQVAFQTLNGALTPEGAYYNLGQTLPLSVATTFDVDTGTYGAGSITAAPEPAAWTLMIVGVGMMGATLRRRRRNGADLKTA